jgi:hypothetical protein
MLEFAVLKNVCFGISNGILVSVLLILSSVLTIA